MVSSSHVAPSTLGATSSAIEHPCVSNVSASTFSGNVASRAQTRVGDLGWALQTLHVIEVAFGFSICGLGKSKRTRLASKRSANLVERLCLLALSWALPTGAVAADTEALSFERDFSQDGSFVFPSEFEGQVLRMIAVGGGGAGSNSLIVGSTGRVGSGGGSGAISYIETTITGSREVRWKVGKGGESGGETFLAPVSGKNGEQTSIQTSFGPQVIADGGQGGVYVASGLTTVKTSVSDWPAPSMGGVGGIPRGMSGEDGKLDFRFTEPLVLAGGQGGRLPLQWGAGGDGASIHYTAPVPGTFLSAKLPAGAKVPGKAAGAPGHDGRVILQVGIALPSYLTITNDVALTRAGAALPSTLSSDEATSAVLRTRELGLDLLLADLRNQCVQLSSACPASVSQLLNQDFSKLPYETKAAWLISTDLSLASLLRTIIGKTGVPTSLWGLLIIAITPAVANAPGVDNPLAPAFKDLTGDQLVELMGAYDAVATTYETNMGKIAPNGDYIPLTPDTIPTVNNLRAYGARMRRELAARRNRQMSDGQSPVDFYGGSIRDKSSPPSPKGRGGPGPAKNGGARSGGGSEGGGGGGIGGGFGVHGLGGSYIAPGSGSVTCKPDPCLDVEYPD